MNRTNNNRQTTEKPVKINEGSEGNALLGYDLGDLQEGDQVILEGVGDEASSTYRIDQYGNAVLVEHEEEHEDGNGAAETSQTPVSLNIIPDGGSLHSRSPPKRKDRRAHPKPVGPPGSVLLTGDSLTSRPIMHVSSGRPIMSRDERCATYTNDDLPTSSGLPSMRPVFRMCADAVLGNTPISKAHAAITVDQQRPGSSGCSKAEINTAINENLDESEFSHDLEEEASGNSGARSVFRSQLNLQFMDWPLYWDSPVDFQEACEILCGFHIVDSAKMCTTVPQEYKKQGTFVIDLSNFKNRHDVGTDNLGPWGKPACKTRFYTVEEDNSSGSVLLRCDDCRGRLIDGADYTFKCYSKRYEHPCTTVAGSPGKFVKKIFTAIHPGDLGAVSVSVVTYEWSGEPFEFEVLPKLTRIRKLYMPPVEAPVGGWEAASFGKTEKGPLPNGMSEMHADTPIYAVGAVDFNAAASIILGGVLVDSSKTCRSVPQGFRIAGTFVVDIKEFESDAHLRLDNLGYWGKPAGHSRYYKVDPLSGDAVRVDSGNKLFDGVVYDIQILSKRYEHPSTGGRFVRKIYVGRGSDGTRHYPSCSHLAVITYYWKGEPIDFDAGARQNEIHTKSFNRDSLPSARDQPSHPSTSKRRRIDEELNPGPSSVDMADIYKREYENQVRLTSLLDRAEQFLERMENSFPGYNEAWNNNANQVVVEGEVEYAEDYSTE